MDYKKKIEYAKRVASQLEGQKSSNEIKSELKAEGLYDRDITNIMVSARNIVGETYLPRIKEFLLADRPIIGAQEFETLDSDLLNSLISKESQNLTLQEKKKLTKLIKEGHSPEEILRQVDTRFLPLDKAALQIKRLQEVKTQNSGGSRMLNIAGGIGLCILTWVVVMTTGRLFYFLPILGLFMIFKGLTTEQMEHDS